MPAVFRNVRIASIRGIPIEMSPSWLLTLGFFVIVLGGQIYPELLRDEPVWLYWLLAGLSAVFFCASIIFHELAHSLVARLHGIPVRSITLLMLGGVSQMKRSAGRPLFEFTTAIVGPLSSILLAGVFLGVAFLPGVRDGRSAVMWQWLFFMNLGLGVINLAPGLPMDGGKVLRAALWGATGNFNRATYWASLAGRGLGYALMGAGMLTFLRVIPGLDVITGIWLVMVGYFLDSSARQSWTQVGVLEVLRKHTAAQVMQATLPEISQDATILEVVGRHFDVRFGLCAFAVDDEARVTGMLTAAQLVRLPKERWAVTTVRERMLPVAELPVAAPSMNLADAIELMDGEELSHLPVVEDGRLTGYIQRGRIVMMLHAEIGAIAKGPSTRR